MRENTKLNVFNQEQTDLNLKQGTHLEILSTVDPSGVNYITEFKSESFRDKIHQLFMFSENKNASLLLGSAFY